MKVGICKLTGQRGKFIKSHLLPKALTRPEYSGAGFVQTGREAAPSRRWDSWYDDRLVIQAGEDILTALDTWAIPELRKHHLVWSGWGPMLQLASYDRIPGTPWGIRAIEGIDPKRLRLFLLSLLWRAAASSRREFAKVQMPSADLEKLRAMLVAGEPGALSFYPAHLSQLSTRGLAHNHAPLAMTKRVPALGDFAGAEVPFFRFYLDGLIIHFHRHASDDGTTTALGDQVAGASERLLLSTITFEESFQRENIGGLMREAADLYPDRLVRLYT
jgi:hypothetical protein